MAELSVCQLLLPLPTFYETSSALDPHYRQRYRPPTRLDCAADSGPVRVRRGSHRHADAHRPAAYALATDAHAAAGRHRHVFAHHHARADGHRYAVPIQHASGHDDGRYLGHRRRLGDGHARGDAHRSGRG